MEPIDAPGVSLISVEAGTEVDKHGNQIRTALAGAKTVLPSASFRLRFDRFLLPVTATRQSVCLRSDTAAVATFEECTGAVEFSEPTYDPVHREVTYRLRQGDKLNDGVEYQLTVLPPKDAADPFGFRAFDRAPLTDRIEFRFQVKDPKTAVIADTLPAEDMDLFCANEPCRKKCATGEDKTCIEDCASVCDCDPADEGCTCCGCDVDDASCRAGCVVDCENACTCTKKCEKGAQAQLESCGLGNCHGSPDNNPLPVALGLDLTPLHIAETAIDQVAHQTQTGEHAHIADESPLRFGRAMPIIDRGNAGNSYLLYKVLLNPEYATTLHVDAKPGEIARLQAAVAVGLPMPPANFAALSVGALDVVSLWISAKAPTPSCNP